MVPPILAQFEWDHVSIKKKMLKFIDIKEICFQDWWKLISISFKICKSDGIRNVCLFVLISEKSGIIYFDKIGNLDINKLEKSEDIRIHPESSKAELEAMVEQRL